MCFSVFCLFASIVAEFILADYGRWDAAFAVNGNKPVGFDFEGSPFGDTDFLYNEICDLRYDEVFTGMIFYKPLKEHSLVSGYEKYVTGDFVKEMRRRWKIWGRKYNKKQIDNIYNKQRTRKYDNMETLQVVIDQLVEEFEQN